MCFCFHLCSCPLSTCISHSKDVHSHFTQTFTVPGVDRNRGGTVSLMRVSLFLFCTPFVLPVHKHLPCLHPHTHIISLHGGHRPLPSKTETGRRSLFLTALVDWLHPQPCTVKKSRVYFLSACTIPTCLQKFFLLVWQSRCVSLCVNVYILLYMCERTKWVLFFCFACWCFFSACCFTCEWFAVRHVRHFFELRSHLFVFYTFYIPH